MSNVSDWNEWADDPLPANEPAPIGKIRATPFVWTDPEKIPRREWIYGRHLIRRYVSTTVSPGGLGKSSLLLVEAIAMASGRPLIGDHVHGPALRVWYWNGEDPQDETDRRVVAAAVHYGLKPDDFASRLWTDTGRHMSIKLAATMRGDTVLDETLFTDIEAALIADAIDVWILDPFISAHQVPENDNGAIDAVVKRLGIVAERTRCAIELVHHVRKPGGGNTAATDVNDARGASALIGGVRSARVLNVMSKDEADLIGIDGNDRLSYFRVDNGKSNLAKRTDLATWRRIISVDLGNGGLALDSSDHVGVVTEYKLPGDFEHLPSNAAEIAVDIALRHPEARYDKRSGDWFGHLVGPAVNISSMEKTGASTLSKLIDVWIGNGTLVKRMAQDSNRKMREFITAPTEVQAQPTTAVYPEDDCPF